MSDNNNGNDSSSPPTFRSMSDNLQAMIFGVVGGVFELLGQRDLEWATLKFLEFNRNLHSGGLSDDEKTTFHNIKDFVERTSIYDLGGQSHLEAARNYLRTADTLLNEDGHGDEAIENIRAAVEPLYLASVPWYAERAHFLLEPAFILSGVFLNPFTFSYDELTWEMRGLCEKYLRFLEHRNQWPDLPRLGTDGRAKLASAVQKLQWVTAQISAGNIERSLLAPRLREVLAALLVCGKEEFDLFAADVIPAFDALAGGFVGMFLDPASDSAAQEAMEGFEILAGAISFVQWATFGPDSLEFKFSLVESLLDQVLAFVQAHPNDSRLILALCQVFDLLQSLKDGVWEKGRSIWDFLGANTCLPARFQCAKADASALLDVYNNVTLVFDAQHIEDQTSVLRDIRDLLQYMKDEQDGLAAQVAANIAEQRAATQQYLLDKQDLFEPPALPGLDATPFVNLPAGTIRKEPDGGAILFFLPDGTLLRVSANREFFAVLPGSDAVEPLTVLPDNSVKLSDGRTFAVLPEEVPHPTQDEVIAGLPDGSTVSTTPLRREALLPDGTAVRYYPAEDLVAVLLPDGSESLITFAEVRGLGCTGQMTRISNTVKSFSFSNQVAGVADWETGFEILLPSGVTVNIRRERTGLPGSTNGHGDENGGPTGFTCQRRST
jgi:hypothetical protein